MMAKQDPEHAETGRRRGLPPQDLSKRQHSEDSSEFSSELGVFMISVAAELSGMHPQTLRIYEQRGLIKPKRSPKQTRLYSRQDVERLQQIQELTTDLGMNLAGVERVLELEKLIDQMQARLDQSSEELQALKEKLSEEVEAVHRSYRRELVLYDPGGKDVVRATDATAEAFQIPIEHKKNDSGP